MPEDWITWGGADGAAAAALRATAKEGKALPLAVRRRATELGRKLLECATGCGETVQSGRYVLASRHGEFSRALSTLTALAQQEPLSPADFSMAVHHGLTGLLSIHAGNMAGHTALAAGPDSFGYGLLEAAICLAENPDQPVILLYADDKLPGVYAEMCGNEEELPLVLAFTLEAGHTLSVCHEPMTECATKPKPALDFLRFFLSGAPEARSAGTNLSWSWKRHV